MKNILTILLFILFLISFAYSKTIEIPAEFQTIQDGINAATDGDTVLVHPGTYDGQIYFFGKKIVVGSLFLTTNEPAYISSTIIDGNQKGSVVIFRNKEDSSSVLCGFTITNGKRADYYVGSGIECDNSGPVLKDLIITGNRASSGGGIFTVSLQNLILLQNVTIENNQAELNGGGICQSGGEITLENVIVRNNFACQNGGGLYFSTGKSSLKNVTIHYNQAKDTGGGIYCRNNLIFDKEKRCNLYLNQASFASDFYRKDVGTFTVILDTFTVKQPTVYHLFNLENIEVDILHGKIEAVNGEIFVSPDGDNRNSGKTANDPVKTISWALTRLYSDSTLPGTINLAKGTYSALIPGENFPIHVPDNTTLIGESEKEVILDAEKQAGVIRLWDDQNVIIKNITITGGKAEDGGGIYANLWSEFSLENVTISENESTERGGGINAPNAKMNFRNVIIEKNRSYGSGGGIRCGGYLDMENCNILYNSSSGSGGGIYIDGTSINSTWKDVLIKGNSSTSDAGGIFIRSEDKLKVSNVTVCQNTAADEGGGFWLYNNSLLFDDENRCNIYQNKAPKGADFYSKYGPVTHVIVDTFTVMEPTEKEASILEYFTFDILHSKSEIANGDLYVNPVSGNDSNSGISANEALKTIAMALNKTDADSSHSRKIYLANGYYSTSANREVFPIMLPNYVSLIGESKEGVILDAESRSSTIYLEKTGKVKHVNKIQNVTIKGGMGRSGGGVCSYGVNLDISNVLITNNRASENGGGIFTSGGNLTIFNTTVSKNEAVNCGGGLLLSYSNVHFQNTIISKNKAENDGGGIYNFNINAYLNLENVTISENQALNYGGGFYGANPKVEFSTQNRCNIYNNSAAYFADIYCDMSNYTVVLDTFSVLYPTGYHIYPARYTEYDILHAKYPQHDCDIYVSPAGDNQNPGTTPEKPLKTINYALGRVLPDSANPNTVHLANGVYSPSTNGEIFPLYLQDDIILCGESENNAIINPELTNTALQIKRCTNLVLKNFSITRGNPLSIFSSGGVYCIDKSNITIENLNIYDNYSRAIYCAASSMSLNRTKIYNNGTSNGAALYGQSSNFWITNSVIYGNRNREGNGCLFFEKLNSWSPSTVTIVNSIFWDNDSSEIAVRSEKDTCQIAIAYSDIQHGKENLALHDPNFLFWLDGNMDTDPLFTDAENGDFSLQPTSPCVDAGIQDTTIYYDEGRSQIVIPEMEFTGTGIDIGAVEDKLDSIIAAREIAQKGYRLLHSYPNPFNPGTTIEYNLPKTEHVRLEIFDILGRSVAVLVDCEQEPGTYRKNWISLAKSSGLYFCRITTPSFKKSIKLMLVK